MGTASTSSLTALRWFNGLAAGTGSNIPQQLVGLQDIQLLNDIMLSTALIGGFLNTSGPQGILMTATTAGTTALTVLASVSGPPLSAIQPGDAVIGAAVSPGTYIAARTPATGTPTSLTLSQVALTSSAGQRLIIAKPAMLTFGNAIDAGLDPATGRVKLPDNRGYIQLNPGDYVAVDPSGAVIVVPANSVSYAGTVWSFT